MRLVRQFLLLALLFSLGCAATPEPPPPPPPPPPAPPVPPPPPPPDPRDFTAAVPFDAGSAQLTAAGIRELTSFAAKLEPYPERTVKVVGYSEATEIETADPWLSERRAKSVAAFLVFQGIASDHVSLEGLGPVAPASDGRLVKVSVR
jgi:OOP family OmpA-OmpF porin